ncbi:MAG: serine/threonine-protein phosphatase, partial [Actinobacteria bacterium]
AGTHIVLAHAGDSRAYLLSNGTLTRLTLDHSMVADLVRSGTISEAEARVHPNRSVITRALGTDANMPVDTYEVQARPGDRLLLCTDGLHGMIEDPEIARLLGAYADPGVTARALADAAIDAGGQDNVTVVVVEVGAGEEPARSGIDAARRAAPLLWVLVFVALVASAGWGAWAYARSRAYLAAENGVVVVYRGVQGDFAGVRLAWREAETTIPVSALPPDRAARLADGIPLKDLADAWEAVALYRTLAADTTSAPATAAPGVPAP